MLLYIKKNLKQLLKYLLPPQLLLRIINNIRAYPEEEIRFLKYLCDPNKISIDVGAYDGLYTARMYFYSLECYAFEPRKLAIEKLRFLFGKLSKKVKIEDVALSDHIGKTELKIFINETGRSTIEKDNKIENDGAIQKIEIEIKKLDDYNFNHKVGFIKIDVEGHEFSVLKGSINLLLKDCPNLLIEIEERHKSNSVFMVKDLLESLGYKGFFLMNRKLHPIDRFNLVEHQNLLNINNRKKYINNFIFVNEENLDRVIHSLV